MKVKDLYWMAENTINFPAFGEFGCPVYFEPNIRDNSTDVMIRCCMAVPDVPERSKNALLTLPEAGELADAIGRRLAFLAKGRLMVIPVGGGIELHFTGSGERPMISLDNAASLADWLRRASCRKFRDYCGYTPEAAR